MTHISNLDRPTPPVDRPLLVCLLPARNAEHDLPGYLDSVGRCCDAIVALDDGSTDETWNVLNRHPLVKVLLRNPGRKDYRVWDDAANRNRLLAAAAALDPVWLLSLDADERLDARDATSLRNFLETDALPGCAYGFRHVQMRHDTEHFLPKYQWVYRLFSAAPDQQFPNQKLHFIPVPTSIPRHRWIKTTLRIQHLGGLTADHRLTRFNKYLEADPGRIYQADYAHLLASQAPEDLRRWQPRPDSVQVLLASGAYDDLDAMASGIDPGMPALSAIIISRNDERTIATTVASVVEQEVPEPFEVIVVTSGTDRTASIVRENFPGATVVELAKPALPGEARNAGLAVARGRFVTFPGSHIELLPGSLAARLRAHRRGYAMVTGVVTNGTLTPAGWASYFLDQAEGLPGHVAAELNGPPANCSYARLPLLEVGGFPEGVRTGEDTAVNRALVRRGYVAFRDPGVQFIHRSRCTTTSRLVRHHFQRGRGWGRMLVAEHRVRGGLLNRKIVRTRLIDSVPKRLGRIQRSVALARQDIASQYQRTRRLVAIGAIATWVGMWYEILRPTTGKASVLIGHPVVNILIIGNRGGGELAMVQIDEVSGQTTFHTVSSALLVPHNGQLVSLADIIDADRGPAREMKPAELRQVVGVALNVADLECIVGHPFRLSTESMDSRAYVPEERVPARLIKCTVTSIATLSALRRHTLRSTLPWWTTVRVINRIQAHARP